METVRKLYDVEQCSKKGLFSFLNSDTNRKFQTAIFINNLLDEYGISYTKESLEKEVNDTFINGFINKKEEEYFKNSIVNKLIRFKDYLNFNGFNLVGAPSSKIIELNGTQIRIKYDLILEKDGVVFVSRVKDKKPDLKLRGKIDETAIFKSIELYGLYSIGKKIFPTKEVKGAIFYLANEKDTNSFNGLSEFEFKNGKNIVTHSFEDPIDVNAVKSRLNKILNNDKCGNCDDCYYTRLCNFTKDLKPVVKKEKKVIKNKEIQLTEQQEIFSQFDNGNCLVLAIAGSGKSTVLANRFTELIKKGVKAETILGLTFTIQGVIELKDKLNYWGASKGVDCSKIKIMTFNEFCYDLIKKNHIKLGYTDEPKILDKLERIKIISALLDKNKPISTLNYVNPTMDYMKAKGAVFACMELIDEIDIGQYLEVEDIMDITRLNEENAKTLSLIFNEYKSIMKNNNYINIEQQIELGSILLKPAMIDTLGYEHIVVDEAQDTNLAQLNILTKLSKYLNFKSLAICGDDSQSIYGWRGADNKLLVELDKYIPDLFRIKLEDNFRSTIEICNLANLLNNKNTVRIDKEMKAKKHGKKPELIKASPDIIAKEIKSLIDNGESLSDIAFIARNKKELVNMQFELKKLQIPSIVAVSELLIDNHYFRNIADLANFYTNYDLTLNFSNYLNMIKSDEFNNAIDLNKFIEEEKELLISKIDLMSEEDKLNYYLESIKPLSKESNAIDDFMNLCKGKGFKTIKELTKYVNDLINFKSDITTKKDIEGINAVTLITAHSSKGKEYKNVFLSLDSLKEKTNDIEEERRILFVAITRAKEFLKISYDKNSIWSNEISECLRFI